MKEISFRGVKNTYESDLHRRINFSIPLHLFHFNLKEVKFNLKKLQFN